MSDKPDNQDTPDEGRIFDPVTIQVVATPLLPQEYVDQVSSALTPFVTEKQLDKIQPSIRHTLNALATRMFNAGRDYENRYGRLDKYGKKPNTVDSKYY
jgi:hypothetical protein